MIDQYIGNYRIVRLLGEGGMGAVYEGRHQQIGRRAAIKVLHAELARDPQIVTRFLNEARAANLVQHPGIVDIYEHGQIPGGAAYIVMQYLDGESLRGRLGRLGTLGGAALRLGRQMASALAAAHEHGIVHRDLKPENIMVVADPEALGGERAKVLDFGIAKLAAELRAPGEQHTRTGTMMGTPAYMAPEQCRGLSALNDRADVYALGIMLYEMVNGVTPFQGDMGELIAAHIYSAPPHLLGAPELDVLLQRMLQKAPASRPSMRQVAMELERLGSLPVVGSPTVPMTIHHFQLGRERWWWRHRVKLLTGAICALLGSGALVILPNRLMEKSWPEKIEKIRSAEVRTPETSRKNPATLVGPELVSPPMPPVRATVSKGPASPVGRESGAGISLLTVTKNPLTKRDQREPNGDSKPTNQGNGHLPPSLDKATASSKIEEGIMAINSGRYEVGYQLCHDVTGTPPFRSRAYVCMGDAELYRKRFDRAIDLGKKALKEKPGPQVYMLLGKAYYKKDNCKEATLYLSKVINAANSSDDEAQRIVELCSRR